MPHIAKRWAGYNERPRPIKANISGDFQNASDLAEFLRAMADRVEGRAMLPLDFSASNMPFHFDIQVSLPPESLFLDAD